MWETYAKLHQETNDVAYVGTLSFQNRLLQSSEKQFCKNKESRPFSPPAFLIFRS